MNKGIADKENLYRYVEFLTSVYPARNYQNVASLNKVASYILSQFQNMEAETEVQTWIAGGLEYKNIIATYNPHQSQRLIVGAHYDVYGDQPGADDNASAVAGLLETARMVFLQKPDLDYRIDFVAYALEEPPFYKTEAMGSYVHAKSLYNEGVDVIGMICYEMIGYFSDEPNSQSYPDLSLAALYPGTANFIIVVGIEKFKDFTTTIHQLMSNKRKVDVQVIHFPTPEGLAGMSDQWSYWQFGYPALMINDTSFLRNPHYHQITDTIDTLNFEKMTEVVNSAYQAVIQLGK